MTVIDPDTGRLTGKDSGVGRYPEVARIVDVVLSQSGRQGSLQGKRIVVTTGGTVEPIDAVRFIGNRSSGRQGLAVAYEALREGAEVTVIAGATEEFSLPGINLLKVESAAQMQEAMQQTFPAADALVMAAAVADARPLRRKDGKIEKSHLKSIELIENPDLLAEISQQRRANQIVVGFAAETEGDLLERGRRKMHKKGTDLLFATDVSGGAVFGEHQTSGVLITKRGEDFQFQGADKHDVARAIVREIARELSSQNG
jgi:phosphopantothenoylcysteine decarboxylase/phosphopantothenate--cysteine ligase